MNRDLRPTYVVAGITLAIMADYHGKCRAGCRCACSLSFRRRTRYRRFNNVLGVTPPHLILEDFCDLLG